MKKQKNFQTTPYQLKIVEVIFLEILRGDGTKENPTRYVYQYWTKNGDLIAEIDTLTD